MNIFMYIIKALSFTITNPSFLFVLFIIGLVLYGKNKKSRIVEKMILGSQSYSALELTLSQIVIGIIGGVCATIMCTYLGIAFKDGRAIILMFLISMGLMVFKPKFICFSYSGAVLGLISFLYGFIASVTGTGDGEAFYVNIISLVSLVGVLHIVEGLMVSMDGHKGALPVFTKRNEETIGGFALNRYYSLPMILLVVLANESFFKGEELNIASWWPVLNGTFGNIGLGKIVLSVIPVLAIVGYNSVTFTKSKKNKSFISGVYNILYGMILIGLSQVGVLGKVYELGILILMPLLHELMLKIEIATETKQSPKYYNEEKGIRVLEVGKNSIAQKIGIKSGDILLSINDMEISDEIVFIEKLKKCGSDIIFKLKRENGVFEELRWGRIMLSERFGTIFVPKKDYGVKKDTKFKDIMDKAIEEEKDK